VSLGVEQRRRLAPLAVEHPDAVVVEGDQSLEVENAQCRRAENTSGNRNVSREG